MTSEQLDRDQDVDERRIEHLRALATARVRAATQGSPEWDAAMAALEDVEDSTCAAASVPQPLRVGSS